MFLRLAGVLGVMLKMCYVDVFVYRLLNTCLYPYDITKGDSKLHGCKAPRWTAETKKAGKQTEFANVRQVSLGNPEQQLQ